MAVNPAVPITMASRVDTDCGSALRNRAGA